MTGQRSERANTIWTFAAALIVIALGFAAGQAIGHATRRPEVVTVIGPGDLDRLSACQSAVRLLQAEIGALSQDDASVVTRIRDESVGAVNECLGE